MRKIQFRVWDVQRRKFISDYLFDKWGFVMCSTYPRFYYDAAHETTCNVMQFIGITDKNGLEIYEGDILKNGTWVGMIVYEAPEFKFNDGSTSFSVSFWEFEVIGNIYEHPEMLNINQEA